jgi:cytidylate kinase
MKHGRVKEVSMLVITITHVIGSDGLAIAQKVAAGLNLELYDDSRLKEEAIRLGLRSEELKALREKAPDWFDRIMSDKPKLYLNLTESVVYEAARRGEGVIIGHGSQVLLRDFGCAMHVLVTAQEESRIRYLMQQKNLSREAAQRLIRKNDRQKKGFFQYAFDKDWDDPTLYDLCVNPDKICLERAAQLIMDMARSPELKACSMYALDALERLSQTKRIEASLMEMDLRHIGLRVEMPEKGVAHISGVLFKPEDKKRIPAVVGRIPGIEKVQMDVTLVPAGYD